MSHPLHYTEAPHDQPDAWHRHVPEEEGLPQEEHGGDTRPPAPAPAFVICFAFVAGTILASYLYFQVHMTALRRKVIESNYFSEQFAQTKNAELARLAEYSFPTEDMARKGLAMLPGEEGKKRSIAGYAGGSGQE